MAFCFLAYLFSFWRYLRFCIISDDVIGGSTKTALNSIKNNSRNIKAVFFKLGTSNVHWIHWIGVFTQFVSRTMSVLLITYSETLGTKLPDDARLAANLNLFTPTLPAFPVRSG